MELLIAERVRENRKRLGLTQEELAGRLGVSPQTVSYWENGGYPDITMLPDIAGIFGITVDELLGRDEESAREEYRAYRNDINALPVGVERKSDWYPSTTSRTRSPPRSTVSSSSTRKTRRSGAFRP